MEKQLIKFNMKLKSKCKIMNQLNYKIFLTFLSIIILLSSFNIVNAQTSGITSTLTQQGLSMLGVNSQISQIVQLGICASSAGTSCLIGFSQGIIEQAIISKLPPEAQKAFGLYEKLKPLINSKDANINSDLKLDSDGNVIEGELELKNGKEGDISNFFNDLKDGEKVSATNLLANKDKQTGITTLFFNKDKGELKIGDNVFNHIAGNSNKNSFIKMNNKGSITEANFLTDNEGGDFNINGIKINAPANALVNFKAGMVTPGKLTMQLEDGSVLKQIPTFEEGKFGNVEISSKAKSDGSAGSYILPDGTKVKGTLVYSDSIPEGYIAPLQTVIFNDQITVRALSQPVRYTPEIISGNSNFFPGKDYNTAYGNMNIQFVPGNKGAIEINLKNAGTYFSIADEVKIDTWVDQGGESKFYVGKKIYTYKGKDFFEGPFYSILNPPIDVPTSITAHPIKDVNGKLEYVPGETVKIEGTQKLNIKPNVETFDVNDNKNKGAIYASQNAPPGNGNPAKSIAQGVSDTGNSVVTKQETTSGEHGIAPYKQLVPEASRVSSSYGWRKDPFIKKTAFHDGIDIAAPEGAPIYPYEAGIVTFIGTVDEKNRLKTNGERLLGTSGQKYNGYGNIVEITNGNLRTFYGHMKTIGDVGLGQHVTLETQVGEVGSTGKSTGDHAHVGYDLDGKSVDPMKYLKKY